MIIKSVCVCVCACVRACVRARAIGEGEREGVGLKFFFYSDGLSFVD